MQGGCTCCCTVSMLCCHSACLIPPYTLQVNNAAAQRLFAGQLHVKMHMQQKGGGSGSGKAKAARTSKKAGGDGGAAAAAAAASAAGGGQASGRGAVNSAGYQQHHHQHAAQQYQQLDDPIDLCDDDDEEDGSLRVTVVMKALMDLNAFLRKQRGAGRAPFQTVALQRVCVNEGEGSKVVSLGECLKVVHLAATLPAQGSHCPSACR